MKHPSHLEFSKQQIQEFLLLLIITTYKGFKILKSLKSFFSSSPFSREGEIWREGGREFVNLWTQNLWERKLGPEVLFQRQFERTLRETQ
jgi:hypothetical protein